MDGNDDILEGRIKAAKEKIERKLRASLVVPQGEGLQTLFHSCDILAKELTMCEMPSDIRVKLRWIERSFLPREGEFSNIYPRVYPRIGEVQYAGWVFNKESLWSPLVPSETGSVSYRNVFGQYSNALIRTPESPNHTNWILAPLNWTRRHKA